MHTPIKSQTTGQDYNQAHNRAPAQISKDQMLADRREAQRQELLAKMSIHEKVKNLLK